MSAKNYVVRIIGLTIIVLIVLTICIVSLPESWYMDGEYSSWIQQKDYIYSDNDNSEVIFLGDSRMKAAVNPMIIDDAAYNLALGGGTSIEMYYTLVNYLEHHPCPKKVIIGFAPIHYTSAEVYYKRSLYFHYLPISNVIESQYNIFKENKIPIQQQIKGWLDVIQYTMRMPTKYYRTIIESKLARAEVNTREYEKVFMCRGHRLFGIKNYHNGLNQEAKAEGFVFMPVQDYYLRKILDICHANEIPVFIEQLPMNPASYNKMISNGYYKGYCAYLEELSKLPYVAINKNILCYDADMFGDSNHLNLNGSKKFSMYIKEKYFQ